MNGLNWPWTSSRDRILKQVNKRLSHMEKAVDSGIEDDQLDEIVERMDRLEKLMSPEPENIPGTNIAPQFAGIWERIPRGYRSIVDGAVEGYTGVSLKDALSDPSGAKMKIVMAKIGPHMNSLMKFIPKNLMDQLQQQPTSTGSSGNGSGPQPAYNPYEQMKEPPT